jgi:hypothetical protein
LLFAGRLVYYFATMLACRQSHRTGKNGQRIKFGRATMERRYLPISMKDAVEMGRNAMTQESKSGAAKPDSSEQQSKTAPTANSGTPLEKAMKELSSSPRFKKVGKSGDGFVIGGAKR